MSDVIDLGAVRSETRDREDWDAVGSFVLGRRHYRRWFILERLPEEDEVPCAAAFADYVVLIATDQTEHSGGFHKVLVHKGALGSLIGGER